MNTVFLAEQTIGYRNTFRRDALSKSYVYAGFAGPAAAHPTAVLAAPHYRRRRLRAGVGAPLRVTRFSNGVLG